MLSSRGAQRLVHPDAAALSSRGAERPVHRDAAALSSRGAERPVHPDTAHLSSRGAERRGIFSNTRDLGHSRKIPRFARDDMFSAG